MDRLTRRAFLTAAAGAVAGCGGDGDGTPTDNPAVGDARGDGPLELTSPAFDDGDPIPPEYSRDGDNVNPPLRIAGVPDGAATLALIVDDPDAPGGTFLHWLVWNVPAVRRAIPEGWDPANAVVGENGFGNRRYDGPDPPSGTHTYRFKCYALDTALEAGPESSKLAVGRAMRGHVLGRAQLEGTFSA